ncbi:MAG: hypothetical protein HZA15_15625 [Nitrospirae bacterium]|nr:hypothetical protein [Nitrospirota bacterium]
MKRAFVICLLICLFAAPVLAELQSSKTIDKDGNTVIEITGGRTARSSDKEPLRVEEDKAAPVAKEEKRLPENDVKIKTATIREFNSSSVTTDVSFKLDILNDGPAGRISIGLQGVDKDGYEVLRNTLSADFTEYQNKTITESRMFLNTDFSRVREWNVKTISKTLR